MNLWSTRMYSFHGPSTSAIFLWWVSCKFERRIVGVLPFVMTKLTFFKTKILLRHDRITFIFFFYLQIEISIQNKAPKICTQQILVRHNNTIMKFTFPYTFHMNRLVQWWNFIHKKIDDKPTASLSVFPLKAH